MKRYLERYVFIGIALLLIYRGSFSLINTTVAMDKLEGFLCLLIASILVTGAYIINAIQLLHKETTKRKALDLHIQNLTERLYKMEKAS